MPYIRRVLELAEPDIVSDGLWALAYITENSSENAIPEVVHTVQVKTIMKQTEKDGVRLSPILRTLGNICTGAQEFVDEVLKSGAIALLSHVFATSQDPGLLDDACWAISNLANGPCRQLQSLIDSGLMGHMCKLIMWTCPSSVRFCGGRTRR